MTVQELDTLPTICEVERNQPLTILAMSVQNPQLAGFLLTGNQSNFLYIEGSTARLYDCPHFLSPLYITDRCLDKIPIHFKVKPTTYHNSNVSIKSTTCWLPFNRKQK